MKTVIGLAIAGILSIGTASASIGLPNGNGELMVLVVDTTTHDAYVRGLGTFIQNLQPASSIKSSAVYNTTDPSS